MNFTKLYKFLVLGTAYFTVIISFGQKLKTQEPTNNKHNIIAEESFLNGVKFLMLEDDEKALKQFKKTISVTPKDPATNHFISQILQRQFKFDEALEYAKIAFENNSENEYYYTSLANIYFNLGNLKEAAKIYEKVLKKFASEEDYYFDLAEIYSRMKKWDKSIEVFNRFSKKYGDFDEIVYFKQSIYLQQNKIEEALKEGQLLIDQNPSEAEYTAKQCQILLSNNQEAKAIQLLENYTKTYGDHDEIMLLFFEIYKSKNETEKANEYYLKAFRSPSISFEKKLDLIALQTQNLYFSKLKNNISSSDSLITKTLCDEFLKEYPLKAKAHSINADYYNLLNDKKAAQFHFSNGLKLDDSDFKSWEQLVLIDAELQEYDSLIKHSNTALELFPNKGVIWYFNGSAYNMIKDYPNSIKSFEMAKKLSQSNIRLMADINAQLGDVYNANKDFEKSDQAYDDVLAVNPNDEHVLNNYSYYLSLRNENLEKAYEMSKKTLDRSPNNSTYIDTHAWVLYKMGKFEEAEMLLGKIVDDTNSGEVKEHYADILFKLNQKDKALEYWKKAKEIGGGSLQLDKKIDEQKLYE